MNDFLDVTRAGYDAIATGYVERFGTELVAKPFDRALVGAFAELVADTGPVVDVGCGPGRVAAFLHDLGLAVHGIDLSPRMVELARRAHPAVRFEVGSMTALDLPDGALGGLVAFYSIIHIPVARLPDVFTEFRRVLVAGGQLLLAFQVGDEPLRLTEAFGHAVSLDFHRRQPDDIATLLRGAGFAVTARLVREPDETETSRQAYLLARTPSPGPNRRG